MLRIVSHRKPKVEIEKKSPEFNGARPYSNQVRISKDTHPVSIKS